MPAHQVGLDILRWIERGVRADSPRRNGFEDSGGFRRGAWARTAPVVDRPSGSVSSVALDRLSAHGGLDRPRLPGSANYNTVILRREC
jgi:hypothetical protein